jgi:hypothetical protein
MDTATEIYEFKIDAFTPDSLPMARLAEYLTELSKLLGHQEHVHFRKVKKGSAVLQAAVEYPERPKVAVRLSMVRKNEAPDEAIEAQQELNRMLQADNAVGYLRQPGVGVILEFPGRKTPISETVAVVEQGELDGQVIRIGGRDNTIPVWLRSSDRTIYRCTATENIAKELIKHYLGEVLRVVGIGKWRRTNDEGWALESFQIKGWQELSPMELGETIATLRAVEGSNWNQLEDPLAEWKKVRGDQ